MYKRQGCGCTPEELGKRPHIGIANTFSENSAGHAHLRQLADAVKQGIWQAGGIPFEFGVPSTCAEVAIGSDTMCMDLAMRDLVAGGIEVDVYKRQGIIYSLGIGVMQVGSGLHETTGIPITNVLWTVITFAVVILFTFSSKIGLEKGMKVASDWNIRIYIVLLAFVPVSYTHLGWL